MLSVFPVCYCLVVSTSAINYLERIVSEMTYYVSSGMLNPTQYTLTDYNFHICWHELKQFIGIFVSDELYTVPGMRKVMATQERKPSSVSNDSNDPCKDDALEEKVDARNWSCNAGDSGRACRDGDGAGIKTTVQEQKWSSAARDMVVPQKKPCPAVENCDFKFKVLPPTGLYISPTGSRL